MATDSHLGALANWLETPLKAHPHTELVLVMVVAPVMLNVVSGELNGTQLNSTSSPVD